MTELTPSYLHKNVFILDSGPLCIFLLIYTNAHAKKEMFEAENYPREAPDCFVNNAP